jgi:hypothetical protein
MVVSPWMPHSQFLVAAFKQSTILFAREILTIQLAFQNEEDFVRNLICLAANCAQDVPCRCPLGS